MKKFAMALMFLTFALPCAAQQLAQTLTGTLNAASTTCNVSNSCVWMKLPSYTASFQDTVTVTGTWSGTLIIEGAGSGRWFTVATLTSNLAATAYTVSGYTDFRVRMSAYTSGTADVTVALAEVNNPVVPPVNTSTLAPNQNVWYVAKDCGSITNCTVVKDDGQSVCDAKLSAGSDTINSPTANWTSADVGKQIYATTLPCNGFTGFYTSTTILTETTIKSVTDAHDIVVNANATGGGGANVNTVVWGDDDGPALLSAFNAAMTFPCRPLELPGGMMLTSIGLFNGSMAGCYAAGTTAGGQFGFGVFGKGENMTTITPLQSFDYTTGAGNSCDGGLAQKACFLGVDYGNFSVENWQIWGAGLNDFTTTGLYLVDWEAQENAYLDNFQIVGWGAAVANTVGIYGAPEYVQLTNITSDGAGATGCEIALPNGIQASSSGLACEDNATISLYISTGTNSTFSMSNTTAGPILAASGSRYIIENTGSGVVVSSGTNMQSWSGVSSVYGLFAGSTSSWLGTGDTFLMGATSDPAVQLSGAGSLFSEAGGKITGGSYGVLVANSGDTAKLFNTTVNGATHALETVSGSFLYDLGSNTISGGANSIAPGTIYGFLPVPLADLGPCDSAHEGLFGNITNSDTPTYFSPATSAPGTLHAHVGCNGTNWIWE